MLGCNDGGCRVSLDTSVLGSVRISFKTCSQSASGLRSPALARAMILLAMACLTSSAQSPGRRATQAISRAAPMARVVSASNFSPFRNGLIGIDRPVGSWRPAKTAEPILREILIKMADDLE